MYPKVSTVDELIALLLT